MSVTPVANYTRTPPGTGIIAPATTATTRASAGACTVASTMNRTSSPSTISMRPGTASLDASGDSTTTGTNPAPPSAGVRYRRRHVNNTLV